MRRPHLALATLLLTLCGCAASLQKTIHEGGPLKVQAAAVLPFQFRWDEPAYRSFELSQALALQVSQTNRYAVFGPNEFKLVQASASNPFVGTDLALSLADHGLSPMAALVFRPSAEKRAHSETKQVFDAQGRPKGVGRVEQSTVLARLEVFHSASREVVAELSGQVEVDPLAERDGSDPLPELTTLMQSLMEAALDALEDRAPGQESERELGFSYVWNPKVVLDFTLEGRPPLRETIEKADLLEQDVLLESRLRFFHPEAEPALLAKLSRLPAGLLVTEVAEGTVGLAAGDLIMQVDGGPALPQALQRAVRAIPAGGKLALRVKRSSGLQDLKVTLP